MEHNIKPIYTEKLVKILNKIFKCSIKKCQIQSFENFKFPSVAKTTLLFGFN